MERKHRFVSLAESGHFTVSELCREFGISRKTGYKWLTRYRLHGSPGLEEKSRAPNGVPGKIALKVERVIVSERRAHPRWGPKKIRQRLICRHGIEVPSSVSTIGAVLRRNGMVTPRRRRGGRRELGPLLDIQYLGNEGQCVTCVIYQGRRVDCWLRFLFGKRITL